jgi:hypothetical protein
MENCVQSDMMERITKTELVARLEKALQHPVGMTGLNILLFGWKKFRRYGLKYCNALKHRDWLYIVEVQDFSAYVGYDLTQK